MLSVEEVLAKFNQRVAEIRNRTGVTTGSQDGTEGRDRLFGSFNDDFIRGFGGDDLISGNLGNDTLDGGIGNDDISGGAGDDMILGNDGNDKLFGQVGDDVVFGGAGNDLIDGSLGSDVLFGGDGNDNITGGPNGSPDAPEGFFEDYVVGGKGSDTLKAFGGSKGAFEVDWLIGGGSVDQNFNIDPFTDGNLGDGARDIFVLGDANGAFYTQVGNDDYALIFDFELGVDQLRLGADTVGVPQDGNTLVIGNVSTNPDLVAIMLGVETAF